MNSEYAQLIDLALAQGWQYSQIAEEVRKNILYAYSKKFPKALTGTVMVDEVSGEVRLMSGKEDLMPDAFKSEAEAIARQTILTMISEKPEKIGTLDKQEGRRVRIIRGDWWGWILQAVFWGYHLFYIFFLILITFGLGQADFREDLWDSLREAGAFKVFLFMSLLLTPILTAVTAMKEKLYKNHAVLMRLFLFVEIPVILLLFLALSVMPETMRIVWLFVPLVLIAPVVLSVSMRPSMKRNMKVFYLGLIQLVMLTVVYLTSLYAFFTPPLIGAIAQQIFGSLFYDVSYQMSEMVVRPDPFNLFGFLIQLAFGTFFLIIGLLLLAIPYIASYLLVRKWWGINRTLETDFNGERLRAMGVSFGLLWFVLVIGLSYQPGAERYMEKLTALKTEDSFEKREQLAQDLLPHEKEVKTALLDLYEARNRYFFTKSDRTIEEGYEDVLNWPPVLAEMMQQSFLTLAYPFTYQGETDQSNKAAEAYQYLFGHSIYDASIQPTEPSKNVTLTYRTITVTPGENGLSAEVTVEEELENTSFSDQEVVYEFSLPEESVITALKLGPNLEFEGQLAPRGAARQTYEQEVNRRRDPALLEQTGNGHYRLRVFPVPAKNSSILSGKPQKVQFTYVTLLTPYGYGLPHYYLERNIKVGEDAIEVSSSGKPVKAGDYVEADAQVARRFCETDEVGALTLNGEQVSLVSNASVLPAFKDTLCINGNIIAGSGSKRIALAYDVSYPHKDSDALSTITSAFRANSHILTGHVVDFYRFNDKVSQGNRLTMEGLDEAFNVVYFGDMDLIGLLNTLKTQEYDALVIVSQSLFEERLTSAYTWPDFPVYLVSEAPPVMETQTIQKLLANGGGVYATLDEAFNRFLVKDALSAQNPIWTGLLGHMKTSESDWERQINPSLATTYFQGVTISEPTGIDKVMVRRYMDGVLMRVPNRIDTNIALLDATHQAALKAGVITPYSSYIALVNDQQQATLDRLSESYDRFRTSESGPVPISGPSIMLEQPRSFGIGDSLFGQSNLRSESSIGVGNRFGANAGPSMMMDGGGGGIAFAGLSPIVLLFILFNAGLLTTGMAVALVRALKRKKEKKN